MTPGEQRTKSEMMSRVEKPGSQKDSLDNSVRFSAVFPQFNHTASSSLVNMC